MKIKKSYNFNKNSDIFQYCENCYNNFIKNIMDNIEYYKMNDEAFNYSALSSEELENFVKNGYIKKKIKENDKEEIRNIVYIFPIPIENNKITFELK